MLHIFDEVCISCVILSQNRVLPSLEHERTPGNMQVKEPAFTVCAGKLPYNNISSDHDKYNLMMFDIDVRSALPKERVLHLRGDCPLLIFQCTLRM